MTTKVEMAVSSYVDGSPGTLSLATTLAQADDVAVLIITLLDQDVAAGWDTGWTVLHDGVLGSAGNGKLWAAWRVLSGNGSWEFSITPGGPTNTPIGHVSVWRDAATPSTSRPQNTIRPPAAGGLGSYSVVVATAKASDLTKIVAPGWDGDIDSTQSVSGSVKHAVKSRQDGPAGIPYLDMTIDDASGAIALGYVVQPDLEPVRVFGVINPYPAGPGF